MLTDSPVILVILIFVLRVLNFAIGTVRLVAIARNQRLIAAVMAGVEALIFAVVITGVVQDLQNIPNLIAYCGGASVGSWLGMELESRLVRGYMIINVFANQNGQELAAELRDAGFGVTLTVSEGRDGQVMMLRSVVDKRDVKRYDKLVNQLNGNALVAMEEARGVRHGWFGLGRGKPL